MNSFLKILSGGDLRYVSTALATYTRRPPISLRAALSDLGRNYAVEIITTRALSANVRASTARVIKNIYYYVRKTPRRIVIYTLRGGTVFWHGTSGASSEFENYHSSSNILAAAATHGYTTYPTYAHDTYVLVEIRERTELGVPGGSLRSNRRRPRPDGRNTSRSDVRYGRTNLREIVRGRLVTEPIRRPRTTPNVTNVFRNGSPGDYVYEGRAARSAISVCAPSLNRPARASREKLPRELLVRKPYFPDALCSRPIVRRNNIVFILYGARVIAPFVTKWRRYNNPEEYY